MVLFTQQMSNKWNCVLSLVIRDAKLINLRVKVKKFLKCETSFIILRRIRSRSPREGCKGNPVKIRDSTRYCKA